MKNLKKKVKKIVSTPAGEEFLKKAQEIKVIIDGTEFIAKPRIFSTGSHGWYLGGKVLNVKVEDQNLKGQISMNLPVRGTKSKEEEE